MSRHDPASVTRALEGAGCVAAREEADELLQAAKDDEQLEEMLARRLTGEPLAWITGCVRFCGLTVAVEPGVYVPRWQSEPLAVMAARLLPPLGLAVDLCTGAGAVAMVMRAAHPDAHVVTTEIDPRAAQCARRNGLVVYEGSLDEPLPADLRSKVDVLTGVLPYVPTVQLAFLPRDVQTFEPRAALDGGTGGIELISIAIRRAPSWIRPGGWMLLEIGGDQVGPVTAMLADAGFENIDVLRDDDGDARGIFGQLKR